jgi:hypothetical protein
MGSRAALSRTRLRPRGLRTEDLGEDGVELVGKRRAPPSLDHSRNRDPRECKGVDDDRHQRAHHKGGHDDAEHLEHAYMVVPAATGRNRTTTRMRPQIPLVCP